MIYKQKWKMENRSKINNSVFFLYEQHFHKQQASDWQNIKARTKTEGQIKSLLPQSKRDRPQPSGYVTRSGGGG